MNILEKIALKTAERIKKEVGNGLDRSAGLDRSPGLRLPHDFRKAFEPGKTNIIAEVKLASPSEGKISELNPVNVAGEYLKNGAAAVSVLTEPYFFNGNIEYLKQIREKFPDAKLLMKDFIIDEYQLLQARAYGADAILLIASLLGEKLLGFINRAKSLELTPLVEVHDEDEMLTALEAGAELIGVNNRNLKTMEVSLAFSEHLAKYISDKTILISESGIKTKGDISKLSALGYQGFLVGTSFMRSGNPGMKLAELLETE